MADDATTQFSPEAARTPPARRSDPRVVAGTILAGRYRILTLLGRGGMGEVYKADDLELDHPVALKFLPDRLALDPGALARFHAEVRIARQVSHPNVCRVYDIGDIDGLRFLTMEYIDGEDLGSLLRRIKRLPADTAVEVARQICAGLAAAHDAGVVHRDLKPANVMIDGRGRARLTDFGIAAIARDMRGADVLVGTPSYMAPEQLTGQNASVRSDIFALGLVLYEIFTGKRAVEASSLADVMQLHATGSPLTTPSNWLPDLNPVVERAVMRCLDRDPARRPASAVHVAAALPGGDPLQAALAAGELPSPEMVAAAGHTGVLRPVVGVALCAAVVVGLIAGSWMWNRQSVLAPLAADMSPAVLAHRAREILAALGYAERGADSAHGFRINAAYLTYDREQRGNEARLSRLLRAAPSPIQFWYRESPESMVVHVEATETGPPQVGPVTADNPPVTDAHMRQLYLDAKGRLTDFRAVPPEIDEQTGTAARTDWDRVFALAGLDRRAFHTTSPTLTPRVAFDERMAWEGVYPGQPDLPLRLEAAAYRGRLVSLRSVGPWSSPEQSTRRPAGGGVIVGVVVYGLVVLALVLGWANVRAGRGDRRGAFRIGMTTFILLALEWALGIDHVTGAGELIMFRLGISSALFAGVSAYLMYLALEPFVRRRSPQVLVGWSRALSGDLRDPLVSREVLLGLTIAVVWFVTLVVAMWITSRVITGTEAGLSASLSIRRTAAMLAGQTGSAIFLSIATCFLVFFGRVVLRRRELAEAVVVVLTTAVSMAGPQGPTVLSGVLGALQGLGYVVALRFGLVALISAIAMFRLLPLVNATMAWSSGSHVFMLLTLFGVAGYATYVAIGSPAILPKRAGQG
jgi:serine/threonine-protein kinase